jgi:L-aminopeptidase/D-esterase-like protein
MPLWPGEAPVGDGKTEKSKAELTIHRPEHPNGTAVVICPGGTVGGVEVRGAAPGTRETDVLAPHNSVPHVHAVLLSGGSAFGLDAASGVMKWL